MKNKTIFAVFLYLSIISCSNDDDTDPVKSDEKEITSFSFRADDNEALSVDINGVIDKDKKTITAEMPEGTTVNALKPTVAISENATVSPKNKIAADFSSPVTYTVTAEDESTVDYTVTVTVAKSSEKQIDSFIFLAADNDALKEDIIATIDETSKSITAELPYDTALNALIPTIAISDGAEVDPKDKVVSDFTKDLTYMVTAANGTTEKYTVTVTNAEITDRDVLVAWYNLNPDNALSWDFSEDINNWEGVTVENGRVTKISIGERGLAILTPLIDNLTELNSLVLIDNKITDLPVEVGNLEKLEALGLTDNELAALPSEIGNLKELKSLNVNTNEITKLPIEIGNLENLIELELEYNQLTDLPIQIGQLEKLRSLSVYGNRAFSSIPNEIGSLTELIELNLGFCNLANVPKEIGALGKLINLRIDDNVLTNIPVEFGNLSSMKTLLIQKNQLTQLPRELGMLSGLLQLNIEQNLITQIPKEICDLDDANLALIKDPEAKCEE